MKTSYYCRFLVLLCCQYGVSYRIYILPEPGAFCLGIFSGDDCITWSEYSANPAFVYHSTTLIFTPGNYSLQGRNGQFSVTSIKTLILIGDGAQLQFQLSLSNIGYVGVYSLAFQSPRIDVSSVDYFVMKNCNLYETESRGARARLLFYASSFFRDNLNVIVNSTFEKVVIEIHSYSTITITACYFTNYSTSAIIGDSYSSVNIQSSRFINNFMLSGQNYLVYIQGSFSESLTVTDCLFDRISGAGAVYSSGDMIVMNSNFTSNEGYAVIGYQNINISKCIFSYCAQSSSVVYSPLRYSYPSDFVVLVSDSEFYHCSRPIYGQINVTVINSNFLNITAFGGGAVVYSTDSITLTNCTIMNSTAVSGDGGAVYSEGRIGILNSLLVNISAMAANSRGGTFYSSQLVTVTNCSIINSFSAGYGGAIYGGTVGIINSTLSDCRADTGSGGAIYSGNDMRVVNSTISNCSALNGKGGAIFSSGNDMRVINSTISDCSALNEKGGAIFSATSSLDGTNVVLSKSTFNNNSATSGGVLFTDGRYHYDMEFSDSTFTLNRAFGSITGGGVACIRNATLSITNSVFEDNIAAADGGVLDLKLSSVSVQHSLFFQNEAINNGSGGVFFGRKYTTNFTVADTVFTYNSAGNGRVFYV